MTFGTIGQAGEFNKLRIAKERDAQEQRRRRRAALDRLPDLLAGPDPLATPIGPRDAVLPLPEDIANDPSRPFVQQRELLGVLGDADPEGLLSSVLASQFPTASAPTSAMQEMLALDLPFTAEGFAEYQKLKNPQNSSSQQLQDILTALQIKSLERDIDNDNREDAEAEQIRAESQQSIVDIGLSMISALEGAEDSVIARPGSTLGDTGRDLASVLGDFAGLLGADGAQQRLDREVQNFDTVDKNQNLLIGKMLEQSQASGITATRSLQRLYEESTPGSEIHSEVSKGIIADLLEKNLAQARRDGRELKGAAEARAWLKTRRTQKFKTEADAEAALKAGKIKPGQTVTIGGRKAVMQ